MLSSRWGQLSLTSIQSALRRISALRRWRRPADAQTFGELQTLHDRIEAAGLFDPNTYLSLQPDVRDAGIDPWWHFLRHGLAEGRHFTSPESAAGPLAKAQLEFPSTSAAYLQQLVHALEVKERREPPKSLRIGIYCNTHGNFYMNEIADLLALGLRDAGHKVELRSELSKKGEYFQIRIFVAPHEFFFLGKGKEWKSIVTLPNTVLYNVEQVQTQWFCQSFFLLLKAPLVLDLNFQTANILRKAGCNAIFYFPGYLEDSVYTRPERDISSIDLVRGYRFRCEKYDWLADRTLSSRPIDVLFIGARTPYRDKSLARVGEIADFCRFLSAYRMAEAPVTRSEVSAIARENNWALSQRAKIVLNLHRDWIGYFEWSRMVLRGFWQGACVVTDPGLPTPVFESGVHYLEESPRHLPELIRWLLLTDDGRDKMTAVAQAGFEQAQTLGSMRAALTPVLVGFERLPTE